MWKSAKLTLLLAIATAAQSASLDFTQYVNVL
jgi:hypothetical protein